MTFIVESPIINPSASKVKILWVLTYSTVATLVSSLKTVFYGVFVSRKDKQKSRENIDRVIQQWGRRIVNKAQVRWKLIGDLDGQILENRAIILMCNHACAYDIPLTFAAVPGSIRMIAKKELFKIPFLSRALKTAEFPSIDRQNRQQAIKDLEFARKKMKSGIRIWMFPEGTRSEDGKLQKLKKGGIRLAIDTNAIIIPIVMQDIEHILPNKQWLKMRLNQQVNIRVGQAIDCREYDVTERHDVSELVYNSMKDLLAKRD